MSSRSADAVTDADALRSDFAACLRALAGDGSAVTSDAAAPGIESLSTAFLERAERLRRTFAIAAAQQALASDGTDVSSMRAEVVALRDELAEKEALLSTHRKNLQRWQAETNSVQEASAQLLNPTSTG